MNRFCVLYAFIVASALLAHASTQPPPIQWRSTLGGNRLISWATCIEQTRDGGYIVGGWTYASDGDVTGYHGTNDAEYWVVKLNGAGKIQWEKCLGGTGGDFAWSIEQTTDGGYIVGGWTGSNDGDVTNPYKSKPTCYWVVKLDSLGAIQWEKAYDGVYKGNPGSVGTDAFCIRQTRDGGYIAAGGLEDDSVPDDYWILKLDASGAIQWQKMLGAHKTYEASGDATSIEQTRDGGYIVAGWSSSTDGDVTGNHGGSDYWIVKLDSTGSLQWEKSLGGSAEDYAWSVGQTRDGGYIVGGFSNSTDGDVKDHHGGDTAADYWVVKLDSAGSIQWEKSLGGSWWEQAFSIRQTIDDGYIIVGWTDSYDGDVTGRVNEGIAGTDYWVVKLDSAGSLQWETPVVGGRAYCVEQTADEGYVVAGRGGDTLAFGPLEGYYIVKFGPLLPHIASAQTIDFDSILCYAPKADTLWVHDTGNAPLVITADSVLGHSISGQYSNAFTLVSPATFPVTIASGDSLRFIILFDPTNQPKVTPYTDTLSLISNDAQHNPWLVQLKSVADTENFILDLYVTEYGWDRNSDTLDLGTVPCGSTKDTSFPLVYYPPLPTSYRIKTPDPAFTVPSSIYFDSFHANHQAPVPLMVRFIASNGPGRYVAPVFFTDTCGHTDSAYFLVTITGAVVTVAAPPDTTICAGDSVLLTASGSFSSYQWSDGETTQSIIVKASGTYSVTATNPNGCSANSAPVRVTVNNVVAPVINGVSGICPGGSTTLDAGSGYASYLWSTGETTQAVTVTVPGTYSVTVTQGNCSVTSADFAVSEYPAPTVTITLSGDTLVSTPAVTYQWYLNGAAIPGATSQTYVPFMEGSYTVAVTDTNGCTGTSPAYLQGALSVELCSASPAPVLPAVLIDLPVSLSDNIIAPVDSVAFDVAYNRVALFYLTATSPRCGLRVERVNSGDLHITAFSCGTPLSAGDIADVKFVGLVTSSDTTYTQVNINNVTFYPAGTVTGSGCSIPVTINPYCGLHGVYYIGATSLAQNYPNPFTGTTTIHVTLSQSDAEGAQLKIYNMLGEEVADLSNQLSPEADIPFTAERNKTGVYYYVLQTANGRFTRQMFVVK